MGKHGGRAAIRTREFTSRECEVLRALERGEPMKNIAVDLGIAIGSVRPSRCAPIGSSTRSTVLRR